MFYLCEGLDNGMLSVINFHINGFHTVISSLCCFVCGFIQMNLHEPSAKSFVLVVPELPSDCGTLMRKEGKSCFMDLKDGSILKVQKSGNHTNLQYPGSESKWFIKINCKMKEIHLLAALKFLKLYEFRKKKCRFKSNWSILNRLRDGLPCEDFWTLQGALIDALALINQKRNTGLGSMICAFCHRLMEYEHACCEDNYFDGKQKLLAIHRKIRYCNQIIF